MVGIAHPTLDWAGFDEVGVAYATFAYMIRPSRGVCG